MHGLLLIYNAGKMILFFCGAVLIVAASGYELWGGLRDRRARLPGGGTRFAEESTQPVKYWQMNALRLGCLGLGLYVMWLTAHAVARDMHFL